MRKQLINNIELRKELEKINNWYLEQLERYNNGEIKESTFKSYKTRHRQRRNKIINEYEKQNSKIEIRREVRGLFGKW